MSETRGDYKTRFKKHYPTEMASIPVSVRLPVELDVQVRSLPNRTEWLRRVITEALQKEAET